MPPLTHAVDEDEGGRLEASGGREDAGDSRQRVVVRDDFLEYDSTHNHDKKRHERMLYRLILIPKASLSIIFCCNFYRLKYKATNEKLQKKKKVFVRS